MFIPQQANSYGYDSRVAQINTVSGFLPSLTFFSHVMKDKLSKPFYRFSTQTQYNWNAFPGTGNVNTNNSKSNTASFEFLCALIILKNITSHLSYRKLQYRHQYIVLRHFKGIMISVCKLFTYIWCWGFVSLNIVVVAIWHVFPIKFLIY